MEGLAGMPNCVMKPLMVRKKRALFKIFVSTISRNRAAPSGAHEGSIRTRNLAFVLGFNVTSNSTAVELKQETKW